MSASALAEIPSHEVSENVPVSPQRVEGGLALPALSLPVTAPRQLSRIDMALMSLRQAHAIDRTWARSGATQVESSPVSSVAAAASLSELNGGHAARGAELDARAPTSGMGAPSTDDRRLFPRYVSDCTVAVHVVEENDPVTPIRVGWLLHSARIRGNLIDISMNGVAMLIHEPLREESRIHLRIRNPRFGATLDVSAALLRSIPCRAGEWKVVCQFDSHLRFDQVQQLGRSLFATEFV